MSKPNIDAESSTPEADISQSGFDHPGNTGRGWQYSRSVLLAGFMCWLICCAVFAGFAIRYDYQHKDTQTSVIDPEAREKLPKDEKGTLVMMAAHPQCACTRASISQLIKIRNIDKNENDRFVLLVFKPSDEKSYSWIPELFYQTARENHLEIMIDTDGLIAQGLGINTSGHVLAFARDGSLQFSGGITAKRGHDGDNFYSDQLIQSILDNASNVPMDKQVKDKIKTTPVFGCSISELDGK